MDDLLPSLVPHGTAALAALVFAHQLGIPFPCEIFLVGAGAVCARGELNLPAAMGASALASLAADLVWYEIGRRHGARVLAFLCRVSIEPDSCVRTTENLFERRGPGILVVAKFVPGLSTVAPPLAGMLRTGIPRFLLLDGLGSLLWVGAFLGLGFVFHDQVDAVLVAMAALGAPLAAVVAALVLGYLGLKFAARQRLLRRLRIARVGPEEVRRRIEAGEPLFIVDLRSALDHAADPRMIPGAQRIPAEELTLHHERIPRDRDVILYCT